MDAAGELFDRIIDKDLLIRRLNITATHVIDEASAPSSKDSYEQLDLFTDYAALDAKRKQEDEELARGKESTASHAHYQKEIWEERHSQGDESFGGCDGKGQERADRWA